MNKRALQKKPAFGINYRNVSKRLLPQLLEKGRCFKAWGKKLAVVVQDVLFDNLEEKIKFAPVEDQIADIILFVYSLNTSNPQRYCLVLEKTVGMSHESLLTHVMYAQVPSIEEILAKLMERVNKVGFE